MPSAAVWKINGGSVGDLVKLKLFDRSDLHILIILAEAVNVFLSSFLGGLGVIFMIDDGSYAKIFDKWGLGENKLDKITINDAARFADYLKLD